MYGEYLDFGDYKIQFTDPIGQGCQGIVFKCEKLSTKQEIVAKATIINILNQATYDREIDIVNQIKKKEGAQNLVKIFDINLIELNGVKHLIEFMEKCDSDLGKLIKQYIQEQRSFTFQQVVDFAGQIIKGYSILNSLNIIHRDLKPDNLLISYKENSIILKITDFGVGKVLTNDYAVTKTGTPAYQAPELIFENSIYTSKSDVFSLGVILYQLVYDNQNPFIGPGKKVLEAKQSLKTKPIKCQQKEGFPSDFLELIDQMLRYSTTDRIGWDQLENHYYFKDYFPEKQINQNFKRNFKQFYEYIIAVYQQTCKILQILEKLPKHLNWQILTIYLTEYVLIKFQNEHIDIIDSIKNNNQQKNRSTSILFLRQVDQNEINQALEKTVILKNQNDTQHFLDNIKNEIDKIIQQVDDQFFKEFYDEISKIPDNESLFDFWHLKFQKIYKTYIRTWLSKYIQAKSVTIIEVYQIEKFSYLLEEYPKTSYNNFEYNQIHSKIIVQDNAIKYLKDKSLI